MSEPARTRRDSRRRIVTSSTPADIEVTSPVEAATPLEAAASAVLSVALADAALLGAAVQPLSRRAVRERQRADAVADADAFIAASRAFGTFAAEVPVVKATEEALPVENALPADATAVHVAPRKHKSRRKFVAFGATVGVMGAAGLLAVSMTLPAAAVAGVAGLKGGQAQSVTSLVAATKSTASEGAGDEIQAFVASSDVKNDVIQRTDAFSTISLGQLAAEEGINFSASLYTNDPNAAIQWPFVVGVAMSSGYGMREGGMHEGLDLVPGEGAPIQSIADGTVRIATESGGNYGVTVYVDHVIDGKVITSHYSHMQYGSLKVVAGQTVKVGDVVGLVGNTGRSYGAHLHFELIVNGATIDPLPWMQENAGRYS